MRFILISAAFLCLSAPLAHANSVASSDDEMAAKIVAREHHVAQGLDDFHPLVETYVQVLRAHQDEVSPWYDRHFLSLAEFRGGLRALRFKPRNAEIWRDLSEYADSLTPLTLEYNPDGFVAMAYPDPGTFDLFHYHFQYAGTEQLGALHCLVFDVHPSANHKKGLFEGKIWVEDQNLTIVRFKGIYDGSNISSKYLHFDSWRVNPKPDLWVPAVIYSEEQALPCCGFWKLNWTKIHFRAETRFWGYGLHSLDSAVATSVAPGMAQSSRFVVSAFRSAELNDRPRGSRPGIEDGPVQELEQIGLLSPSGEVEEGLQRIVANIVAANHLSLRREVQCRVLLTSNLESAALGHTIVLSRGLLEFLPNEAVLAAVLAHNLAHISSADSQNANVSVENAPISDPREVSRQLSFEHSAKEEAQANSLEQQWIQQLPYSNSSDAVREFALALRERSPQIGQLLKPFIGESILQTLAVDQDRIKRVGRNEATVSSSLPLARKISIDPWSDRASLATAAGKDAAPQSDTVALEMDPALVQVRPIQKPTNR
jgi:Peptidase family M48